MAMVSLKVKSKEEGKKILEEIISQYKGVIISSDIEELSREVCSEEGEVYTYRKVSRKGGSVYVTIPSSIADFLHLRRDDTLLFVGRKKLGRVYIEKVGYQLLRE